MKHTFRTPGSLSLMLAAGLLFTACGAGDSAVSSDDFPPDPDDTAVDGGLPDDDNSASDNDGPDDDDPADGADGPILGAGPYAVGTVTILLEHPDLEPVSYELACFGDTATLIPDPTEDVRADRACTALARPDVEKRLVDGPPADQVCTEIYGGPDTATVTGMLNGHDVNAVIDRVNGCGIDDWDVLMAEVLPRAQGL